MESPTKHQCLAEACKPRPTCGIYGRFREFLKDLSCEAALPGSMTDEQIRKWVWFFIQKQPNNEPCSDSLSQARSNKIAAPVRSDVETSLRTEGVECVGDKSNSLNLVLPY